MALFTEYQKAPEVTRRRIYLETLQTVMPLLESKIVIDEETNQILPLLQLNQGGLNR
jgi:membrane protease subunit HflK